MKILEKLNKTKELINTGNIGKSDKNWGGADVVIVNDQPTLNPNSFYPAPYYVISKSFTLEISWMFETLRNIFYEENLIDYLSKYEFFSRLAKAANREIEKSNDSDIKKICLEILNEAESFYLEILNVMNNQ